MGKFNPQAYERRLRAGLVRRAIETDAPLLASRLHRYAAAEGMTWAELALSLDGTADGLNQVAICRPPRPESFVADVEAIAADYVAADRLLLLLRRLQVLEALADPANETSGSQETEMGHATLLAARDRENEPDADVELGASTPPSFAPDTSLPDREDDHA
jgi:hypothetical protein